jgi:pyruvate dehydrogenase E1 component alpha subunit
MYERKFLKEVYRKLYLIRQFETECIKLYRQGLIRGYFHPYLGEEAIAVGVCAALSKDDYIVSTHRGHGHCIANGASIDRMIAELLGKKDGYCKGLGGSMHIADTTKGNLGANGIVGAGIPIGVGAALGSKIKKDGKVTVTFSSDGSVNNGVFCEALNLSAAWNLPFILVIENNQYAVSTPISQSTRESDLFKRGESLGVRSKRLDGNNVFEVYEEAQSAIKECRNGKGPYLIEAVTYRHGGHHVNDPGHYLPKEELDFYLSNDPLIRCKNFLIENSGIGEDEILEIEENVLSEIDKAIDFAKQNPELTKQEFLKFVENY